MGCKKAASLIHNRLRLISIYPASSIDFNENFFEDF